MQISIVVYIYMDFTMNFIWPYIIDTAVFYYTFKSFINVILIDDLFDTSILMKTCL